VRARAEQLAVELYGPRAALADEQNIIADGMSGRDLRAALARECGRTHRDDYAAPEAVLILAVSRVVGNRCGRY
jgi:hypothetical protein